MSTPTETVHPCDCGNPQASWHGLRNGHRVYCCAACWIVKKAVHGASPDNEDLAEFMREHPAFHHTPGEWLCDGLLRTSDHTPDCYEVYGPDGKALIAQVFYAAGSPQGAANARLIKMTPTLLAWCELFDSRLHIDGRFENLSPHEVEIFRAMLSKAQGVA